MIDLILTILCTSANAIIIKLAEKRISNRLAMLFCNYVVAGGTGIILSIMSEQGGVSKLAEGAMSGSSGYTKWGLSGFSISMAVVGGAIFATNFFIYFAAIKKRGVALPSALMRLGAVVPLVVSIMFFRESPSIWQVAGIVGALASAVMLSLGVQGGEMKESRSADPKLFLAAWALGLLLIFSIPDLINKLFEQLGEPAHKSTFLAIIFSCAAIFVGIVIMVKRIKIRSNDALWGVILGFPNLFASYFLVAALTKLPAYIVFPSTSACTVLLVAVVAVVAFRERLRMVGVIGMVLTLVSLVAINL
jgi:drug/metabolite transporter (DMT)-like permease